MGRGGALEVWTPGPVEDEVVGIRLAFGVDDVSVGMGLLPVEESLVVVLEQDDVTRRPCYHRCSFLEADVRAVLLEQVRVVVCPRVYLVDVDRTPVSFSVK